MAVTRYPDWAHVRPVVILLDENDVPMPLEGREGRLLVTVGRSDSAAITGGSGSASVSTTTPLTPWMDLEEYQHVLFWLVNLDAANGVNLLVETSEDANHADVSSWLVATTPGEQGSVELSNFLKRYWRMSAYSDGPAYPTVAVQYGMKGVMR